MKRAPGLALTLLLAMPRLAWAQPGNPDQPAAGDGQLRMPGDDASSPLRLGAGPPNVKLARLGMLESTHRSILERSLPRLRECYRRVLEQQPDRAGTGTVTLHIMADGRVADAKVPNLDWLRGCVNSLRALRFPSDDAAEARDLSFDVTVAPAWPYPVHTAFVTKHDEIFACMLKNPARRPPPQIGTAPVWEPTTVTVTFTIAAKGKLSGVSAKSPTASAAARCVTKVARKLIITLPAPAPKKLQVAYPIVWVAPSKQPHPTIGGSGAP